MKAFEFITSHPWLIEQPALENMLAILDRRDDLEALATKHGEPLRNTRTVSYRDGVAIVPVVGPIFRYANLFTEISGATSTQVLATDIQAALDDSLVRGIVLDVNSPGGRADGIHELSQMIFDARGRKPIKAYTGGVAQSAAYWIAAAADEVILDRTAMVGSIGAVMTYLDTRKRDEKSGVRAVEFVSSVSPKKRLDPDSDAGRSEIQSLVDELGAIFAADVASKRGVEETTVRSDFGQGGSLVGMKAVRAGMADRVGSLESVIAQIARNGGSKVVLTGVRMKTIEVRNTQELRAAGERGYKLEEITIAAGPDVDAIKATTRTECAAATKAGAAAERARISGIQALAVTGFEKVIATAIDDGSSVEAAGLALAKEMKSRGITLDQIKKGSNGVPFAPQPPDAPETGTKKIRASTIYESRAQAAAKK